MKRYVMPLMVVLILALIAGAVWLFMNLQEQKQRNQGQFSYRNSHNVLEFMKIIHLFSYIL